jgi:predicted pyridoxine 5'-phosphate oxidase superfamily flavin-nucleotide-binding protein
MSKDLFITDAGSPFHSGEISIQERVGVREKIAVTGSRVIRDYLPDQHRQFYADLAFLFVGALDSTGQPWATILAGHPGFMSTPDQFTLRIAGLTLPGDPLSNQLKPGDYIGGLGLMPTTRRRNRVNGVIAEVNSAGLAIAVKQSFGNCPQYIRNREHQFVDRPEHAAHVLRADVLSAQDRDLIARSDTFFIASANLDASAGNGRGADISHRGGGPGFVRIDDDKTLTAPDFIGNFLFNTLGNLLNHPRAGLLFIDYESGDLLHLAADTELIWDGPQLQSFAGAERLVRFHVKAVHRNVKALPLSWLDGAVAPQLANTGTWQEADQALTGLR